MRTLHVLLPPVLTLKTSQISPYISIIMTNFAQTKTHESKAIVKEGAECTQKVRDCRRLAAITENVR